jgi:hypothetical protein
VNPATGFHAAAGRAPIPSRIQPFQGKSLSLAVRTKMSESKPACESHAMFSMPFENSALNGSRRSE